MTDLNIPNLNKKSDKNLFKKKLTLKRKTKSRLLSESILMLFLSSLLIYINYLIPSKIFLFTNFFNTFGEMFKEILNLFSYFYQIFLVLFIIITLFISVILIVGSINRILKIIKRKTKQISYK